MLHAHYVNDVILTLEMVEQLAIQVGRIVHPGLPGPDCRSLLASGLSHLTGDKDNSKGLMAFQIGPTPTRFPNNFSMWSAQYIKCVMPV